MRRIKDAFFKEPFAAISLAISLVVATVTLIVSLRVWQSTVDQRVAAAETTLTTQQMLLTNIAAKVDEINSQQKVSTANIQDMQEKINFLYQYFVTK